MASPLAREVVSCWIDRQAEGRPTDETSLRGVSTWEVCPYEARAQETRAWEARHYESRPW